LNRDTATRAWRSAGTPPPPGFIRTERPDTFAPSPQASVGPVPQPEIPVGNYVPTAVAGIYGMNFKYIPELQWEYSYFVVMSVIFLICGFLYSRFRRDGWL